ncbi:MAG: hypothetical protein AAF515_15130 [Pseudomonadota bacterium]
MLNRITAALLLIAATTATADESALEALVGTAGKWAGSLYYLDYQSGQRFAIPMEANIAATPDGATVVKRLTWTDPGNLVYAVELTTIDRDTGELVQAFFRDNNGEHMRYVLTDITIESADKWQLVYEHNGTDDDRPARIRHTLTRESGLLISKKSVRFLDDEDDKFFERNGSELRLIEPRSS